MNPPFGSQRLAAYFALAAGVACIAWSAIFVRWTDIPGPASAFYRLLIPAVVLLPTFFFDRPAPRLAPRTLAIIFLGGLFFAADLALFNTSILKTSAANATLLGNNTPVVVGLLTWLVFQRRPNAAFWIGLVLAGLGSLVIIWGDIAHLSRLGVGDAMALGASACFAVYLMVTEKVRTHTSTLPFLRWAICSSALFLWLFDLAARVPLRVPSGRSWLALAGLGLVSQLGGYLALTYALGHLPATVTSATMLVQGPLTALLAVALLAEPLTRPMIAGGLLVIAGVAISNRLSRPEEEANAGQ